MSSTSQQSNPGTSPQSEYREWLRVQAATSDAAFAEYMSGLVFPRHLVGMEHFLDKNDTALVLMPRGHAKTTMLIHRVARLVGETMGKVRIGVLTAVQSDGIARSRAIKTLVESPYFAEVFPWAKGGVVGRKWTDAVWIVKGVDLGKDTTCFADGLTSVKPGPRLDILLADDMVGLRENSTSGARKKAEEIYWQVVDPMLVPGAKRWYIGTRWHEDDFYARLHARGIPTLRRAAIEDGKPLWPSYFSLAELERKREELGGPIFSLQFQNDVTQMGGNIFRHDWLQHVDKVPHGSRRIGVDLAASASERSDYTAAVEVVEDSSGNLYVVGAYRSRIQEGHRYWLTGIDKEGSLLDDESSPRVLWPTRLVGLKGQDVDQVDEPRFLEAVNVESVQYQATFIRELLSETRLPAKAVRPDRDKVLRARALAARYEAGKVFHLKGGPGIDALEREMLTFPNSTHDDMVDALGYAADLTGSMFYFTSASRGL